MFKFLKVFFRKYIFYKNYHKFILEHRLDSTMPWDVIVTDFGGEETINFGPRKESGSALYQIETLATISSRDEVNDAILITIWQWFQSLKKKKISGQLVQSKCTLYWTEPYYWYNWAAN